MLAPVVALAMMQSAYMKGTALFHDCQADIRVADDVRRGADDLLPAQRCVAYVAGYVDGLDQKTTGICVGEASFGTMVRVYVLYMQKNPTLMDTHRAVGLHLSLLEAYPCPKSK